MGDHQQHVLFSNDKLKEISVLSATLLSESLLSQLNNGGD